MPDSAKVLAAHLNTALPDFAPDMRASPGAFVRENPRYLDTIERRTVSYRLRGGYPVPADYPGKRVMAALRALGREA